MTHPVRRALARVPGARSAVRWVRRSEPALDPVEPEARLRGPVTVDRLVRSLSLADGAVVAVLGPASPDLLDGLRAAAPAARVIETPGGGVKRHLAMTAAGPFDVIVDGGPADQRRRRFSATFFQLRARGRYVVVDGAEELGEQPGPLGELLAAGAATEPAPLRTLSWKRRVPENQLVTISKHVRSRTVGGHLLLWHSLPDVLVKLHDSHFNRYLKMADTPHRVVRTIPAGDPPEPAEGVEGPEPRAKPGHRPITAAELSLRDYRDVVVRSRQIVHDGRVLLPDTFRHNQNSVLRHRQLVDLADDFVLPRKQLTEEPPRLSGTYLHLDDEFRGHFGHLMTETISRVWSWPEALELDADTRVLLTPTPKRPNLVEYELQFYEACGIPRDRITYVEGPVRVERLISGSPMFSLGDFIHPRIVDTWDVVGDRLAASAPEREWPRRFFVGRRGDKRSCTNAGVLEEVFSGYGFEVVYPEDYSLGEQVQLFRGAEAIGGYAGSGLFQIAFVPEPTRVITVTSESYMPRNEFLMAAVRRHRIDAVVCRSGGGLHDAFTYDPEREGPFLRQLLDDLPRG
jgi:capsular polysaccharide biosynthesis protein